MPNSLKNFILVALVFSPISILAITNISIPVHAQKSTTGNSTAEADKLFEQGVQLHRQGKLLQALQMYQRVLEIRQQQDKAGIAQALNNMGEVYYWLQDGNKAKEVLEQALVIRKEIKDLSGEAETLNNLGLAYNLLMESDKVLPSLQEALKIYDALKDKRGRSITLSNLGDAANVSVSAGKLDRAAIKKIHLTTLKGLQEALATQQKIGDKFLVIITLIRIGKVYQLLEDYPQALESLNQAIAFSQKSGNQVLEVYSLLETRHIYAGQGQLEPVLPILQKALPLVQKTGMKRLEANTFYIIGLIYQSQEKYKLAAAAYEKAQTIATEIKDTTTMQYALSSLLKTYASLKNRPKQIEIAEQLSVIVKETKDIYALQALLYAYESLENRPKQIEVAEQLSVIAKETKDIYALQTLFSAYGSLKNRPKQIEVANQLFVIAKDKKDVQTLNLLRFAYELLKNRPKQIEVSQELLMIAREVKDYDREISNLSDIVTEYDLLDNSQKVIEYAQELLQLARTRKKLEYEAGALVYLGSAYDSLAFSEQDYKKAIGVTQQGLGIARKIGNRDIEQKALKTLGSIYSSLKEFDKAIEYTQASLKLAQDAKDIPAQAQVLLNFGVIYSDLGNYQKADESFQQGFTILQAELKRQNITDLDVVINPIKSVSLSISGLNFYIKGNFQKAVDLSQQSLTYSDTIDNLQQKTKIRTMSLVIMGFSYGGLKDYSKAIDVLQQGLLSARESKDRNIEAVILFSTASIYRQSGQKDKAISIYNEALAIAQNAKIAGSTDSLIQVGLARTYRDLNKPGTAITYYKQAVSSFEQVRQKNRKLSKDLQESILQSFADIDRTKTSDVYRELANLLVSQGRVSEAQQYLDLLKIQELKDSGFITDSKTKPPQIKLNREEEKITQYGESIIALTNQVSECEKTKCKQQSQLQEKLNSVVSNFNKDLDKIEKEISLRLGDDRSTFRADSPKAREIVKAQPGTVMIYPTFRTSNSSMNRLH